MYIDRLTDMNEVGEIVSGTVPLSYICAVLYLRSCDRPEDAEYPPSVP